MGPLQAVAGGPSEAITLSTYDHAINQCCEDRLSLRTLLALSMADSSHLQGLLCVSRNALNAHRLETAGISGLLSAAPKFFLGPYQRVSEYRRAGADMEVHARGDNKRPIILRCHAADHGPRRSSKRAIGHIPSVG
jgi:hypothetical protein